MRSTRSRIAAPAALLLAVTGVFGIASAASAADEVLRPGASSVVTTANSSWQPSAPDTRVAQQFVQPETGNLATVSVAVYDIGVGYEVSSVAIHEFDATTGPSATPITGGNGVITDYVADDSIFPGQPGLWANVNFPDRPELEAGVRYAIVVDPVDENGVASFATFLFPDASNAPWVEADGVWRAYSTSSMIFTSMLGEPLDDSPEAPEDTDEPEDTEDTETPDTAPTPPERIETASHG